MTFCTHIRLSFWSVAPDKTRKTTLNLLCSLSFTEPHKFHLDWNCNRWSWVEQNLQMSWVFTTTKQTTCRRRVNDLSCSICLYAWWQTARLWMKCFHSQPHYILLKLSATTLWYTSTFQHTSPCYFHPQPSMQQQKCFIQCHVQLWQALPACLMLNLNTFDTAIRMT